MTTKLALALVLAGASAVALNWGFYAQHGQAARLPPLSLRRPVASLLLLFTNRRWLAGFLVGIGGWALYAGALAFGPLSLVQATSAGGIGILALLVWRLSGIRLLGREWIGVGLSVGGLVLLGLSLLGRGGNSHHWAAHAGWQAVAGWMAASAVLAALFAAPLRRFLVSGAGLGVGAGFLYAAGDVGTKAAVAGGARLLFVPALLAAHGLAFVLLQLGFQRGGALATAGVATLFTNAAPIAAGMALFGDPLPAGTLGVLRGLAFATVVGGAALLTRGGSHPEAPPEGGTLRTRRAFGLVAVLVVAAGCGGSVASTTTAKPPPAAPHAKELREPDPLLRDLIGFRVRYRDLLRRHDELVRTVAVRYRAWDGNTRVALLILPRWYGPKVHPAIPLVISPHGRGITARDNTHFWGGLPAFGPFAVVNPEGQGRRLTLFSWGWRGQVSDLARMPRILEAALPWFHVDRSRVYALGSSMGGQETLLLTALHPHLLAGAAALDSATDMAARYRDFPRLAGGLMLQRLARVEIGGTPGTVPRAYALRSPMHYVRQLAAGGVPLHIWWSLHDRIVVDQQQESGRLYRAIVAANPEAPVTRYVGYWAHSAEMHATARLPLALVKLELIKLDEPLPPTAKP